jgi:hypothetical protein
MDLGTRKLGSKKLLFRKRNVFVTSKNPSPEIIVKLPTNVVVLNLNGFSIVESKDVVFHSLDRSARLD